MKSQKKVYYLLLVIACLFFIPTVGILIKNMASDPPDSFPAGFFTFPPLTAPPKVDYDPLIFWGTIGLSVLVILLYVFPTLFGFKPVAIPPSRPKPAIPLPTWFWVGLVLWSVTLLVSCGLIYFRHAKLLIDFALIPLYWGFTLMLDGWVYVRADRHSLVSDSAHELVGIGVASACGWLLFEYLNFFVEENWFYPYGANITQGHFTIYSVIGASGLMPAVFELYNLMNTFTAFRHRYDSGPKFTVPHWARAVLMLVAFFGMFSIGFFPDGLFAVLWIAPVFILVIALESLGIWTPFTPVKKGNWSPLLKYALTYIIYGFCLECFNYLCGNLQHQYITPAFWEYSIPYVNVYHVFEMPLAGYFGYLPFGIYCSVWWISFSFLLNIPTQFNRDSYSDVEDADYVEDTIEL